jgi:type III secretion system FlhB-like substrate exporter
LGLAERGAINSGPTARRAAARACLQRDVARAAPPRVTGKSEALRADEVSARTGAAGMSIHRSPDGSSHLMQVDHDWQTPPALYIAAAEVLAWVCPIEGSAA